MHSTFDPAGGFAGQVSSCGLQRQVKQGLPCLRSHYERMMCHSQPSACLQAKSGSEGAHAGRALQHSKVSRCLTTTPQFTSVRAGKFPERLAGAT